LPIVTGKSLLQVDTHIHAAACMSQKHLLGFMQEKAKKEGESTVLKKEGKRMTLSEVTS